MKRWYRVLALLVCIVLLAACGEVPQAQVDEETQTGVQTVKIYSSGFDAALDNVISAYYAIYPNVRVEKVTPPRDQQMLSLDDWLPAQIADRSVDIVPAYWSVLNQKLLMPLDPYIQKTGFDLKPIEPLLPGIKWDGKLYELPYQVSIDTLTYNPDYFAKYNVAVPTEPMTWDQFRELAAKLSGDGRYGFYYTFVEGTVSTYLAQHHGATPAPYTVAEVTDALQFFSTMVFTDKSMPQAEPRDWTSQDIMRGGVRDYFNLGQAAMSQDSLSYLRQGYYKFKVKVMPMPQVSTGQSGIKVYPQTYGIAANSRHPDAAFQFLAFLAGPQGQAAYARAGLVPAYRTLDVKQAYLGQEIAPPQGATAMLDATWYVDARPTKASTAKPADKPDPRANLFVPFNEVLSGKRSVADAVHDWAIAAKAK